MSSKSKNRPWRLLVQILFFALVALIVVNHYLAESGRGIAFLSSASLHAVCPFGGAASIYQYFVVGTFAKKIHESSFILMYLVLFLTILFGPIFCGWVCPLGSFQEWIGKIGKKLFEKKYNRMIPKTLDKYLRYGRYLVLAWVIYATAMTGKLAFEEVDPYFALFQFWTGEVAVTAFIILALTIAASLFAERPWCKYTCPYGAVLSITSLIRLFRIERNSSSCIDCKACDTACPMNIELSGMNAVRNSQCITCMQCTSEENCPVNETVSLSLPGRTNKPVNLSIQRGEIS